MPLVRVGGIPPLQAQTYALLAAAIGGNGDRCNGYAPSILRLHPFAVADRQTRYILPDSGGQERIKAN